jgi:Tfp pilus assembly protein PilX
MHLQKNNAGFTLILSTVLVFTLTILALSVLSLTQSEYNLGQAQIDRIKADQLAKGILFKQFTTAINNGMPFTDESGSETLDGKTFNYQATVTNDGSGPLGSNPVTVFISYF